MSKFIASSNSHTLYHAIPCAPEGDEIRLSTNWGMNILPEERKKLNMAPDEHPPLLFAAAQLGKALAYTIEKGNGRLLCSTIDAAETEILVTGEREKFMSQPRTATIFEFSNQGFVPLPNAEHQSVSRQAVPFNKARIALEINSIEDVMRAGLQIFTFKEDAKAIYKDKDALKLSGAENQSSTLATLAALVATGKVIWENNARGINPNPKLAGQLGIEIKTPLQAKAAAKSPGLGKPS